MFKKKKNTFSLNILTLKIQNALKSKLFYISVTQLFFINSICLRYINLEELRYNSS